MNGSADRAIESLPGDKYSDLGYVDDTAILGDSGQSVQRLLRFEAKAECIWHQTSEQDIYRAYRFRPLEVDDYSVYLGSVTQNNGSIN